LKKNFFLPEKSPPRLRRIGSLTQACLSTVTHGKSARTTLLRPKAWYRSGQARFRGTPCAPPGRCRPGERQQCF